MNKTRKECREETGYEPEDISKLARTSPAVMRHRTLHHWSPEETIEWVYEGLKFQHQKMLSKIPKNQTKLEEFKKASDLTHNCTGSTACFGCERERRNAYASGGNYY